MSGSIGRCRDAGRGHQLNRGKEMSHVITRGTMTAACGAAGLAVLLMTTGCTNSAPGDGSADGSTSAGTSSTGSTQASPEPSGSGSTGPGQTGSDPSASPADKGAGTASTPQGETEAGSDRCQTPELVGLLQAVEGGGSAGSSELEIVLKNEAPQECVLQGWPGVSFVGNDDGTQIGAAATFDRSSPHETVTLEPGASAHALVALSNAENYGEECEQTPADGLRVYPPGEKRSLFVTNDQLTLTACANPDDELLDVQAIQPVG